MPFRPNLPCVLTKLDGRDIYGQPKPGEVFAERCAIIRLASKTAATAINANASASMGAALEGVVDAVILISAFTRAAVGDLLKIHDTTIKISGKSAKCGLSGKVDHYELTGNIWG